MLIDNVKRFSVCEPICICGIVPWPESVKVSEAARLPKLNSEIISYKNEGKQIDELFKSPISLEKGLETMMVIAAANMAQSKSRNVALDYSKGWRKEALSFV